jgi:hypothetical protein
MSATVIMAAWRFSLARASAIAGSVLRLTTAPHARERAWWRAGSVPDISPRNVIYPQFRKDDCQNERPRPIHLPEALHAFRQKQARTRAEIAAHKIEEGYAELRAAAGTDAAQDLLRAILLMECTP